MKSKPLRAISKILVIDDDLAVLEILKVASEKAGKECITCPDPLRAVDSYLINDPDLIILDIDMPVMNGFEVLGELNKLSNFNTPVVYLTSHDTADIKNEAKALGAIEVIFKPDCILKISNILDMASRSTIKRNRDKTIALLDATSSILESAIEDLRKKINDEE